MSFSKEYKMKIIKENIDNQMTTRKQEKKYCIAEIHIRRWIKLYKYHGIDGLEHKFQKYNSNFKENILKYMKENHLSYLETAMRFNIPKDTTIARWYNKYKENGTLKLPNSIMKKETNNNNKRLEELEKENEYLRAENAYLKKLRALVQKRNQQQNKKKQ